MRTYCNFLILYLCSTPVWALCVDEKYVFGARLAQLGYRYDIMVENESEQYQSTDEYQTLAQVIYKVQLLPKKLKTERLSFLGPVYRTLASVSNTELDPVAHYNQNYIEYYTYERMRQYLDFMGPAFWQASYEAVGVGKSLEGRELFYLGPKVLDSDKSTIVMLGRQHGDEGTANWVIEGFVDSFFKSAEAVANFQLLLYPMINPDGVARMSRHNYVGRDLNRAWSHSSGQDEIVHVHGHLRSLLKKLNHVLIVLDMHGSWREDFIFRVDANFKGEDFFSLQQAFIDELGVLDPWQNGDEIISNGDPNMARIVMVNEYGLNALTHETIKNIPLDNPLQRDKTTLKQQGTQLLQSIQRFSERMVSKNL